MRKNKETYVEKLISPFLITVISFVGFISYIFFYFNDANSAYLTLIPSIISLLSILLIFRSRLRGAGQVCDSESITHDEKLEKRQRQKDRDANYFGSIIFVLSAIYIVFPEVLKL